MTLAAETIAARTGQNETIFVVGEPPLVHYLRAAGRTTPARTNLAYLDTLTRTAYLVTGVYTKRAPILREGVEELRDRLTPIAVLRFTPNDLRLLDDLRPSQARAFRQARDSTFDMTLKRLWTVKQRNLGTLPSTGFRWQVKRGQPSILGAAI